MRKPIALLLLAASCAQSPKDTDVARKAFEDWTRAAVSGDAEKTFHSLSDANLSEWLYKLLEDNEPAARQWRGELTGRPRTDLDLWWGVSHKRGNGRIEPLKPSVLTHPSFSALFRDYYVQTVDGIRTQFRRMEITQVYADDTGVTVVVKAAPGAAPELYGLIYERDGWKIDSYRPPAQGGR